MPIYLSSSNIWNAVSGDISNRSNLEFSEIIDLATFVKYTKSFSVGSQSFNFSSKTMS